MKLTRLKVPLVLLASLLLTPGVVSALPTVGASSIVWALSTDTIHVAPPTGEMEIDRASIINAIEKIQPGGTILFAPGLYLVGEVISIDVPQITLMGHHNGTILRGCNPDGFMDLEEALATVTSPSEGWAVVSRCGMMELTGGHVTVRNMTFEYSRLGLLLGSSHAEDILYPADGGYLIEGNTFRNSSNSIRALLTSSEATVIRDNRFINVFHAFSGAVSHFQILDNHISVSEPHKILPAGHPGFAIGISALLSDDTVTSSCQQNLIAGNTIKGHPDGIILSSRQPGAGCQNNVIRTNVIEVQRAKLPATWPYFDQFPISDNDSTLVGVPLALVNSDKSLGEENTFKNNLVEENQIAGSEGLGIEILNASRNRIINNTITRIIRRDPLPGNPSGYPPNWSEANGSGIWISPGSSSNETVGNTFEDIAAYAIVLEGDSNRVELRNTNDDVRDLGIGNRVSVTGSVDKSESVKQDSTHYESKFIDASGLRLHYLDFGGKGLPIVFVHSESWDAFTYADFAPRFTDTNRALAVTRPGYGESEAHPAGFSVATQAELLINFLDALGIEKAVFAGNSSPVTYLTYITEHHPDRVAGVIYLAGMMPMWLNNVQESDPAGAGAMVARARTSDPTARERSRIIDEYRPRFQSANGPTIDVPALAFAGRSGLIGYERFSWPLAFAGSPLMREFYAELPPSPATDYLRRLANDPAFRNEVLSAIQDSAARTLLTQLADDPELQAEVWRYQQETVQPALIDGQEQFRRAFERIQIVPLDVSTIYGYEYRDSPELIESHIKRFLEEIKLAE